MDKRQNSEDISLLAGTFISHPGAHLLFRGENAANQNGLHFTTNREWAKQFGDNILEGKLPRGSTVRLITVKDIEDAMRNGIESEEKLWAFLFAEGCDAVVGYDAMNSHVLDVIVNPKHLRRFKPADD